MMKKTCSIILFVALIIIPLATGMAVVISDSDKPVQIESDRFDVYPDKKVAVFSGNVVVTQEDAVINSDEFFLHYKKEGMKTKQNDENVNMGIGNTGDIKEIEAKGNVTIKQKEKIVTGDSAFFYNDEQKVIVTGNPVMKEGNNTIQGNKVIFFLKENRGVVESSSTKRVTATIYPEEKK